MDSEFLRAIDERVLVFDGAMGTSVHSFNLPLSDYLGLENCTEILCESRPDLVRALSDKDTWAALAASEALGIALLIIGPTFLMGASMPLQCVTALLVILKGDNS